MASTSRKHVRTVNFIRKNVYLVEKFVKKSPSKSPPFLHGMGILEDNSDIMEIYVNNINERKDVEKILGMTKQQFFCVKGATVDKLMRKIILSADSLFFEVGKKFHVQPEKEVEFDNPPLVSVSEAKSSPKKRRISVKGTISQVGEMKVLEGNKVRSVMIHDEGGTSVKLSLWDEAVDMNIPQHTEIMFKNLEVVSSQYGTSLDSTPSMVVELNEETKTVRGNVVAVQSSSLTKPFVIIIEMDSGKEVDAVVDQGSEIADNIDLSSLPSDVIAQINVKDMINRVDKMNKE